MNVSDKLLFQGFFHGFEPVARDYDKQITSLQNAQYLLGKRIDFVTVEVQSLGRDLECNYELRGHLARLISCRKKLVANFNLLITIQERLAKMQKGVSSKYQNALSQFDTFGVPLIELMARENQTESVPKHMLKLAARIRELGLDREGIFRISGLADDVKALIQRYDEGEDVDLSKIMNVHLLCHVFKHFLRELPVPLCTYELYDKFLAVVGNPVEDSVKTLQTLCSKLPDESLALMKLVISLAWDTSKFEPVNKMNPTNLAIVFGMNIFNNRAQDTLKAMKDNPTILKLSQLMIENYPQLFEGAEFVKGVEVKHIEMGKEEIQALIKQEEQAEELTEQIMQESKSERHDSLHEDHGHNILDE